jgi:hypothetical protein
LQQHESLKYGLGCEVIFNEAYWLRGAGLAKRRSIRFALIFFASFLHQGKKEDNK